MRPTPILSKEMGAQRPARHVPKMSNPIMEIGRGACFLSKASLLATTNLDGWLPL